MNSTSFFPLEFDVLPSSLLRISQVDFFLNKEEKHKLRKFQVKYKTWCTIISELIMNYFISGPHKPIKK